MKQIFTSLFFVLLAIYSYSEERLCSTVEDKQWIIFSTVRLIISAVGVRSSIVVDVKYLKETISTLDDINYCGGIPSVLWKDIISSFEG